MDILKKIIAAKAGRLAEAKRAVPLNDLRSRVRDLPEPRNFRNAIARGSGRIRLIAEIKKASPSRGLIRPDFDLASIIDVYNEKAHAVSVLTEEDYFQGRLSYIREVKDRSSLPVLRKDFIIDEYQIFESRVHHADAILLIGAALEPAQARDFLYLAGELGLAVLFEVHDERELDGALGTGAGIIGINNRNLRTLDIDLATTFRLRPQVPSGKVVVSESGIKSREDVRSLEEAGVDAMLVGTSLMSSADIGKAIDELMG